MAKVETGYMTKGDDDPLGIPKGGISRLKDSHMLDHPGKDAVDLLGFGLNGYGEFIVHGVGGQVVKIPDSARIRLAALLLSPILSTEWVPIVEITTEEMTFLQNQRRNTPQFQDRAKMPPPMDMSDLRGGKAVAPQKKGGVIARP